MRPFAYLYDRVMQWVDHPRAPAFLCGLSFAESSFFPIPPDVMLAPMALRCPQKALWYGFLTTLFSVLGGLAGYMIGYFAFDALTGWLQTTHYWPKYETAKQWFDEWGVWVVFVAGFSPIPYKLFTITAGVLVQPLLPFTIASFIGRGARFMLEAILLKWAGPKIEPIMKKYIEWIGWSMVLALLGLVIWFKVYR